jgi:hypothetical protein
VSLALTPRHQATRPGPWTEHSLFHEGRCVQSKSTYSGAMGFVLPNCPCVCVCYCFHLQGGSPVPRGGKRCRTAARSTHPHALQAPSISHPPSRPACIWPVQRGARLALPLCELCPLRKSPRSQSNPMGGAGTKTSDSIELGRKKTHAKSCFLQKPW